MNKSVGETKNITFSSDELKELIQVLKNIHDQIEQLNITMKEKDEFQLDGKKLANAMAKRMNKSLKEASRHPRKTHLI